jgi:hypothetical protein
MPSIMLVQAVFLHLASALRIRCVAKSIEVVAVTRF